MHILEFTFIVLVLCMIIIFLVWPSICPRRPLLIEEKNVKDIAVQHGIYPPLYGDVPASIPLPNRMRFHQPYYHRMMVNYPYYDPYYDYPLPNMRYCRQYPGCHPCPNWKWMQSSICPYRV